MIATEPPALSIPSQLHDGLAQGLQLAPNFAPAYVQMAKMSVQQGDLAQALGLSRKAEQLEPFRSGYHVLSGEIELGMGRPSEAAAIAAYVADRWGGSDRDEALELWERIPAPQRPEGVHLMHEEPAVKAAQPTSVAEGIVKSVTCHDRAFSITLDRSGESLTFHSEEFPAMGFTDTLWVGRDHFSPCFHLNGRHAVVHFKPSASPLPAIWLQWGFAMTCGLVRKVLLRTQVRNRESLIALAPEQQPTTPG